MAELPTFEVPNSAPNRRAARWKTTLVFLAQTEVHVYALSIAASVLLSFYPFLIVISSFCRYTLRWPAATNLIGFAIADFFAGELGQFIQHNLIIRPVPLFSLVLLLFTANGVFEPLEVALNRVWGITENRSYFKNQLLSLGLILLCGGLGLGTILLTAKNQELLRATMNLTRLPGWTTWLLFKLIAIPITILVIFLIYWILPNRRLPARPLWKTAVIVGLLLEGLKYLYRLASPYLAAKLANEYNVFQHSVALLLLSFVVSLILLAGAEWSAHVPRTAGPDGEEYTGMRGTVS